VKLVEAAALAQFTPPEGCLSHLVASSSIIVPKLLHHNPEKNVLIIEDLGQLVTLYQYFSAVREEVVPRSSALSIYKVQDSYSKLGSRIGEFFGQLHSTKSRELVKASEFKVRENYVGKDLIFQEAVLPIQNHLAKFNISNAEMLFNRVLEDYQRPGLLSEQSFILGDFHPGSVLLPTEFGDGSQALGVIDWEFSGFGRGPNGDMAQFLAHLHVLLMNRGKSRRLYDALKPFIQGVCAGYSQQSSRWLGPLSLRTPGPLDVELEGFQIFRSALILHGREMINVAVEQDWSHSRESEGGISQQETVQKGAWYIERAGSDVEEMLDPANVDQLFKEDILLKLFGIVD
jgi:Phosphotransferase enzyme family